MAIEQFKAKISIFPASPPILFVFHLSRIIHNRALGQVREERERTSQRSQRARRKINFFGMALKNLVERINFPGFTPLLRGLLGDA